MQRATIYRSDTTDVRYFNSTHRHRVFAVFARAQAVRPYPGEVGQAEHDRASARKAASYKHVRPGAAPGTAARNER